MQELLDQANQLYNEAKAALKADPPDFATYDAKIAKAFELVTQAEQLAGGTPPAPTDTTASGVTDTTAST